MDSFKCLRCGTEIKTNSCSKCHYYAQDKSVIFLSLEQAERASEKLANHNAVILAQRLTKPNVTDYKPRKQASLEETYESIGRADEIGSNEKKVLNINNVRAEKKAEIDIFDHARREADERARREAVERARREAEERARREVAEKEKLVALDAYNMQLKKRSCLVLSANLLIHVIYISIMALGENSFLLHHFWIVLIGTVVSYILTGLFLFHEIFGNETDNDKWNWEQFWVSGIYIIPILWTIKQVALYFYQQNGFSFLNYIYLALSGILLILPMFFSSGIALKMLKRNRVNGIRERVLNTLTFLVFVVTEVSYIALEVIPSVVE